MPCQPQPSPNPDHQEAQQQDGPARPGVPWKPKHAPGSAAAAPPDPGPNQSNFANRFSPSAAPGPYVPLCDIKSASFHLSTKPRMETFGSTGQHWSCSIVQSGYCLPHLASRYGKSPGARWQNAA
jgi:hypothetical protein